MKHNGNTNYDYRWGIIALFLILLIGLLTVNGYVKGERKKNNEIIADIRSLYLDENKEFLAPDITIEDIERVEKEYLDSSVPMSQSLIEDIQEKYDAILALNQVFVADTPLIVGNQLNDSQQLQEVLTMSQLKSIRNEYSLDEESQLAELIDKKYTQAEDILNTIEETNNLVKQLNDNLTVENVPKALNELSKIESKTLEMGQQPQMETVSGNYKVLINNIAQTVLDNPEAFPKDSEANQQLFTFEELEAYLIGTQVDHRPLIALTFDDGPTPTTIDMLEVLKKHDVKATFFMLGRNVDEFPNIANSVNQAGHEIGNHSYTHPDFASIPDSDVKNEINRTQQALVNAIGYPPKHYRMPYGNGSHRVVNMFPDLKAVFWNIDSLDWKYRNPDQVIQHVQNTIEHRSIILMHDIYPETVETVDRLIPLLKEQGYVFCIASNILDADRYLDPEY